MQSLLLVRIKQHSRTLGEIKTIEHMSDYLFDYQQKRKSEKSRKIKTFQTTKNGDSETRTRDLYVANVSLSQLSYIPMKYILN